MDSKICSTCDTKKLLSEYYTKGRSTGKLRYEAQCKTCSKIRQSRQKTPKPFERRYLIDARRDDKKRGHQTDLTQDFIRDMIKNHPRCSYCGCDDLDELSLDRIDNSIGHLQANVVVACVRCNNTRGNLDYETWLTEKVPGMIKLRASMTTEQWKVPRANLVRR